ncbi:hypothetical protein V5F53_14485 [Xanthobacter sp. V4C-4]|uniref:hypothetical protein n=1 Tax=Xanthobacter cornucopiae TaxID=3119924 RepID=UPI0037287FD5
MPEENMHESVTLITSRFRKFCRQHDIMRLVQCVLAAGIPMDRLAGVKITAEGPVLLLGELSAAPANRIANEWDEVLEARK